MAQLFKYDATVLEVTGKDSLRYLNARLSNDVKKLPIGDAMLAAALTAQGRTEALFSVWKRSDESFLLAATSPEREKIIQIVKKFIVADRVTVTDLSDSWRLFHLFNQGDWIIPGEVLELALSDRSRYGAHLLSNLKELPKENIEWLSKEAFETRRFKAGLPLFPEEINQDAIISESGLDGVISLTKGCYVGQEVLERIDSHGKAPRLLRLLCARSASLLKPADPICASGVPVGKICSVAEDRTASSLYIFAYLKNESSLSQFTSGENSLELLP